eukprot:scaffold4786_cov104-Isochrysis_galbana.AAC.4
MAAQRPRGGGARMSSEQQVSLHQQGRCIPAKLCCRLMPLLHRAAQAPPVDGPRHVEVGIAAL